MPALYRFQKCRKCVDNAAWAQRWLSPVETNPIITSLTFRYPYLR